MDERNPWQFYLADQLDASARYWSPQRFMALIDSDSLEGLTVLDVDRKDRHLQIEIEGFCHDRRGSAVYGVSKSQLTDPQRRRLMLAIQNAYPAIRDPYKRTRREAAAALGVWSMS
jgi:hypothetical protein